MSNNNEEKVVDIAADAKQKALVAFVEGFQKELREKHGMELIAQIQATPNGIFPVMSLVKAQEVTNEKVADKK